MPTTTTCSASSRPSNFARDAVFAAFRPQQARALDQADFIDRQPDQLPRRLTEADTGVGEVALDHLAKILRQVGGDAAGTSAV